MANQKISDLTLAGALDGTELVEVVQAGSNKKSGPDAIATRAFSIKSTTDLAEGANLYYTQGRFDTAFAAKTTDDLAEGATNKYASATNVNNALSAFTQNIDGNGFDLTDLGNLQIRYPAVVQSRNQADTGFINLVQLLDTTDIVEVGDASVRLVFVGNGGTNNDISMNGIRGVGVPTGTTAERPSAPNNGTVRYNTTLSKFEGYEGGAWKDFVTGTIALAAFTTDDLAEGATNKYASATNVNNALSAFTQAIDAAGFGISDTGNIDLAYASILRSRNQADTGYIKLIQLLDTTDIVEVGDSTQRMVLNASGGTNNDVSINTVGGIGLPTGTTAERPSAPNNGTVRYNTTLSKFEGYEGSAWKDLVTGNYATAPSDITVGASPFSYTNADNFGEDIIINGGTVSSIEFTRDEATYYTTGLIAGIVNLSPGDTVRVTYTVAPTMTKVPR